MKNSYYLASAITIIFLCTDVNAQQGSVGIGTETPNSNAVLHLVSPGNNQGLLIPSLTTAQRLSAAFVSDLGTDENGLLVFDSDEKLFYFWQDTEWLALNATQTASVPSQLLSYDSSTHVLTISDGNNVDLGSLADAKTFDWTALTGVPTGLSDGVDDVEDADADPTNELQDLQLSGNVLTITGHPDPTEIILNNVIDTDDQSLSFTSGMITLSDDPMSTTIDLSGYDTDASDDFSGSFNDLADLSTGTDGEVLKLTSGVWVAGTDAVDDADSDSSNELQSLNFTSGVLTLSDDASSTSVDLSGYDSDASDDFRWVVY